MSAETLRLLAIVLVIALAMSPWLPAGASSVVPPPGNGPVLGPLSTALDSIIPGASGVFLGEVSKISEHDDRPVDGSLYQQVELKASRASGCTIGSLYLIRDWGDSPMDPWPRPVPPKPRFSMKPDELQAGHRYWFATAAPFDTIYPSGVAGYWSADDVRVSQLFDQAVEYDAYAWHPEIRSGFVTGWFDEPSMGSSLVRAWLGPRLLWEKRLDGLLTHNMIEAWDVSREGLGYLQPPGLPDTASVLLAEVSTRLDSTNIFGVPAGTWRIKYLLDMWSGRIVASRAGDRVGSVFQAYDRRGRLVYERVEDLLRDGGKTVGAAEDLWRRRVAHWLDSRTGRITREEVSRFDESTGGWPLVDRERGLAAGPLRLSSGR